MSDLSDINAKISLINENVSLISGKLTTMEEVFNLKIGESQKDIDHLGDKHRELEMIVVTGNGDSLRTKIDRLEQIEKSRAKHFFVIWGALIGVTVRAWWGWLGK